MALTISSVSPAVGLTAGRELVTIDGTDFNIAVDVDGRSRMTVRFGAAEATRVRVRSTTRLDCLTPILDPGAVDVTVEDLDVPATATLTDGFTAKRPDIGGVKSLLRYVIERLILEMRRQILENVQQTTDVDYSLSESTLRVIEESKVPALVLGGPDVVESRGPLARPQEDLEHVGGGEYHQRRPQDISDLRFVLHIVDESTVRLTNLLQAVISFFRRNPILSVPSDPGDPDSERREIEMRPPNPSEWRSATVPNRDNLRRYFGDFRLVGVPVGYADVILTTQGGSAEEDIEIVFTLESERLED